MLTVPSQQGQGGFGSEMDENRVQRCGSLDERRSNQLAHFVFGKELGPACFVIQLPQWRITTSLKPRYPTIRPAIDVFDDAHLSDALPIRRDGRLKRPWTVVTWMFTRVAPILAMASVEGVDSGGYWTF